jgi:hypothetical protein
LHPIVDDPAPGFHGQLVLVPLTDAVSAEGGR